MPIWVFWVSAGVGMALLVALAYWQIDIAEGAYLGQPMVTWLYDLTARRYDAIKSFDPNMETIFLGYPLAEALRQIPDALVLDIATGTARLPITLLAQPTFRGQIVGVDASRRMLEVAAEKTRGNEHRLTLIWRSAAHLPFPGGTFDAVTCLEMLEFTPNPAGQLAEAVRVLRPGGLLVTTRRRGANARLMPGKSFSPESLRALLERLGVERVEIEPWQVEYDLVWGVRCGQSARPGSHLTDVLICPRCDTIAWVEGHGMLGCQMCGAAYVVKDGVIEMNY